MWMNRVSAHHDTSDRTSRFQSIDMSLASGLNRNRVGSCVLSAGLSRFAVADRTDRYAT